MAHERLKIVAQAAYEELETKAIIDLIFPMRRFVLDNVECWYHNARPDRYRNMRGHYVCRASYDILVNGALEDAFRYFYESAQWTVREHNDVDDDENDRTIYLEATRDGSDLQITLWNNPCDEASEFVIYAIGYTNSNGEKISINDSNSSPFFISVSGYGEEAEIVMLGGVTTAERLITEARAMIEPTGRSGDCTTNQDAEQRSNSFDTIPLCDIVSSRRVYNVLYAANIKTAANLIDCYEQGLLAHIKGMGRGSIFVVNIILRDLNIPVVQQNKPLPPEYRLKEYRYSPPEK